MRVAICSGPGRLCTVIVIASGGGLGTGDAAAGSGYRVTWGPRLWAGEPLFPWVGIPIDHTLVTPGVQVISSEVGEIPGSDHKWQKVVLRF